MRVLLSSIRLANSPVLERNLPEILVNDRIMTCSSLADIDKCTVLRQFLHVPSAIAEIMSIFLRISYPPLKALKNPVISPERKAKLSVTLFLRGLSSDFCVQPKFYSYPRSPLFLGALGKAKVLLAPRACLKTMLLQAFTSRFIAWSQYLCIAKFSSHLFRTRSGRIGQRRCFLFSKKNARSLIEVANCLGLLINNAFIAQCREGSHRKPSHFKTGKAPYCDTRSTRLSFILFLNLFRKLHNNSARFLHDQGSTRRGARLFSRSTRNSCRLDYIGIQKISQGLRGISRHKEIRFILFLRGLISNLSLATKFYSSPRRPPSIVF